MTNPLVKYESEAFEARERKDFQAAIALYEKIVSENPNWEHGQAFCDLAGCYENIGELKKAEENYLRALNIQPEYYIFVGNYAAFLDQYGDQMAAFDLYLKLLKIEMDISSDGNQQMENINAALFALGVKLGWNRDEVEKRITDYLKEKIS